MKNRGALVLMEQLVVILVFALAASLCLLAFSHAHRISGETDRRDRAVELAASGCEVMKALHGDLAEAGELLEGQVTEGCLVVSRGDLRMEIRPLESQFSKLSTSEILIFDTETGEILYSLTVGWQEVDHGT